MITAELIDRLVEATKRPASRGSGRGQGRRTGQSPQTAFASWPGPPDAVMSGRTWGHLR